MGQDNVLTFRNLIGDSTVGINSREDCFLRLAAKFSGKAPHHAGQGVTHAADGLGGRANGKLVDLASGINFRVVLFENHRGVKLVPDGLILCFRLLTNFDSGEALPFHLVRGVNDVSGRCG